MTEEYTRDSLRAYRRAEREERQQSKKKARGSFLITLLIILLFLGAAFFYLKTAQPAWFTKHFDLSTVRTAFTEWAGQWDDAENVQQVVDGALAEQDAAA